MAAAAGRNVLRVFRSALLPCGCLEGVSVALVCSGVGSKHADAGVLSVPLALWCLSPAVPNLARSTDVVLGNAGNGQAPPLQSLALGLDRKQESGTGQWGPWAARGCWGVLDGLHPPLYLMSQHHWLPSLS